MKVKLGVGDLEFDEEELERLVREATEEALEGPGIEGECPHCGASMMFRAPECTCPSCGGEVVPRVE